MAEAAWGPGVREMLAAVSAWYAQADPAGRAPRSATFLATDDGVRGGITFRAGRGLGWSNALEWARSRLRGRPALYARRIALEVAFDGEVVANPHNGTVVVLGDGVVDKFHFKETGYFLRLYGVVAPAMPWAEVEAGPAFLRVRMPRFAPLPGSPGDGGLLEAARPALEALHACGPRAQVEGEEPFTLAAKVRQLFVFYGGDRAHALPAALEMVRGLEERLAPFPRVLCHGDLWRENILLDAAGRAVLVDVDKALLAPPSYDQVHLRLLHRSMRERVGAEAMARRWPAWAEQGVHEAELRASALLFTFLKGVELAARPGGGRGILEALRGALDRTGGGA